MGILGVSSGILASLLAVGFSPEVLTQFAGLAGIGGIIGRAHSSFLADGIRENLTSIIRGHNRTAYYADRTSADGRSSALSRWFSCRIDKYRQCTH